MSGFQRNRRFRILRFTNVTDSFAQTLDIPVAAKKNAPCKARFVQFVAQTHLMCMGWSEIRDLSIGKILHFKCGNGLKSRSQACEV